MHCWAHNSFVVMVIALGTLGMIDACGQKGPLFLPKPDEQQAPAKGAEVPKTPAPTPVPAPTQAPVPTQAPAPALPPASNAELLAWPAQNPSGCTDGCSGGAK